VFSYVVVLFELLTRARIYRAFDGVEGSVFFNKRTGREETPNIWLVPRRVQNGERANFPADLYCPLQWKLIMEAGWCQLPEERLLFSDICTILNAVEVPSIEQEEEKFKVANALAVEAAEKRVARANAEKEAAFDHWLARHGFLDTKEELSEWDVREPTLGSNEPLPLEKLQTMLRELEAEADTDFKDMMDDLFGEDDAVSQGKFRDAVAELRTAMPQPTQSASGIASPAQGDVLSASENHDDVATAALGADQMPLCVPYTFLALAL
jgi:hypothetical protein